MAIKCLITVIVSAFLYTSLLVSESVLTFADDDFKEESKEIQAGKIHPWDLLCYYVVDVTLISVDRIQTILNQSRKSFFL